MTPVLFHPLARDELAAAVEFYEGQAKGLGAELAAEVRRTLTRLSALPYSGSPTEEDVRRALVRRFPFAIVYRLESDRLLVVAVMHLRRRPGYWKDRA